MNIKPRKRYTTEFKTQVVELLDTGKPVSELAEELCIGSDLIYRWRREAQGPQIGREGAGAEGECSEADELRTLRRENTLLKQENDILKKAAVILGTKPQPNSVR